MFSISDSKETHFSMKGEGGHFLDSDQSLMKNSPLSNNQGPNNKDSSNKHDFLNFNPDDPMFYKQPRDAFIIKSHPATLHCRVSHALDIHFKVCIKMTNKWLFVILLQPY